MDIADLCNEIVSIKKDLTELRAAAAENSVNIAKIAAENHLAPLLVRWVIFPLVSILSIGYGVNGVIS